MDRQDKIVILLMLVIFGGSLIAGTILNAHRAEAEEQAQLQARAEQVESVKAYIQDYEDEEQTREATNQQIEAEKAEQARLEAERLEAERLAREQAEQQVEREAAEAEQARQEAERQAQIAQAQQVQTQTQNTPTESNTEAQGGVLTKEGGVNYFNGSRETWYSSNQLYHYRTNEWTAGADGVYRDKDGYVVVARSDMAQGATLETSLGTGKVYDSGCANGTTDIYTKW
jgi:glucan-binding YG repeat protein